MLDPESQLGVNHPAHPPRGNILDKVILDKVVMYPYRIMGTLNMRLVHVYSLFGAPGDHMTPINTLLLIHNLV